jgi:hypothetical protein
MACSRSPFLPAAILSDGGRVPAARFPAALREGMADDD